MIQKVTTVDGVIEVLPLVVAKLASLVVAAVDSTLGTYAVRAFYRSQADQIDFDAQLRQLHRRSEARQSAPDDYYSML